ncbi:MAG TPA: carboxypeptidase regulatory-like domain-containing protein [Pyrinomonadaceae bacterium]|nr:carboxypeptidase regulatory-like domain-containing protein [Pyrinomonadaceae bacterium]
MLSRRARLWLAISLILPLLSLGIACKKSEDAGETGNSGSTAANRWKPKGNEGTIKGTIALNGQAPANPKPDLSADAYCASKSPGLTTEEIMANNGHLANVFVYIKSGTTADGQNIDSLSFDTPTDAVTLDQNGCHYRPHVLGVMVNQKINITSSDQTTHNIHFMPKQNQDWNQSQPAGAAALTHSFSRSEVMIPVKCNQHPWMKANVAVMKHPFFAVSGDDGTYTIKGVPPGTYTVVAWQEKLGEQTLGTVKVDANGTATADFSFNAAGGATANGPGSLQVMPALEVPMVTEAH